MQGSKTSNVWNVAATHFLTAGFVIPFLVGVALAASVGSILEHSTLLYKIVGTAANLAALWFGVQYSARYIKRKYVVSNTDRVSAIATAYFAVFYALYYGVQIALVFWAASAQGFSDTMTTVPMGFAYKIIETILSGIVFSYSSKISLVSNKFNNASSVQ